MRGIGRDAVQFHAMKWNCKCKCQFYLKEVTEKTYGEKEEFLLHIFGFGESFS